MKTNSDMTALVLNKGKVFTEIANKLKKDDSFEVKTPTCTAAVRGTQYFVSNSGNSSKVTCLDGNVEVRNRKDKSMAVISENEEAKSGDKKGVKKAAIDPKNKEKYKKESEVKPITKENEERFEKINSGDKETRTWVRKNLRSMSSSSQQDDENDVDMFFFKSSK